MYVLALLMFLFFAYRRSILAAQFFQQEAYETMPFLKFIFYKLQFIDKRLTTVLFIYTVFSMGSKSYFIDMSVLSGIFIVFGFLQQNPLSNKNKKKLVLTLRAKAILASSLAFDAVLAGGIFYTLNTDYLLGKYCLCNVIGYLLLLVQALPIVLVLINLLLKIAENFLKYYYVKKAKKKIRLINPIVIGITGSFGKTSTKNILDHILSSVTSVYTTARSINTLVGIAMVILKDLKPKHKYFIAEIGTSAKGKIAKICKLVKPNFGMLTAIGFAHFANFKTQDDLALEKLSLIESVKNSDGVSVINSLQVDGKFIPKEKNLIILSDKISSSNTYKISNQKESINGVSFTLSFEGKSYNISAPIYGLHQTNNIAMAFIMAIQLGISPDTILALVSTLPQIENRLEVKKLKNGITIIDDGFNSNVEGFVSALDTLETLKGKGRGILITPGMVELGKKHQEHHIIVAKKALEVCDIVIAVVPDRIKDFVNILKEGMTSNQLLILVGSFKEALEWTDVNAKSGDVILYENDLLDLFETKINI